MSERLKLIGITSIAAIVMVMIGHPSPLNADVWTECSGQSRVTETKIISACFEILSAEWARGYQRVPELGFPGDYYFARGNFDLAVREYSSAVSIEPNDFWLYGKRALANFRADRSNLALKDASIAIGGLTSFGLPYLTRAVIYATLNQRTDALQDLWMAEQKQTAKALIVPKNLEALRAYILRVLGADVEEGRTQLLRPELGKDSTPEHTPDAANRTLPLAIPLLPPAAETTSRYAVSSTGSGFVVDSRGYVVTNNHVAANCKAITVTLPSSKVVSAAIILQGRQDDLALIGISEPWPASAAFADYDLRLGQRVVVLGYPLQPFLGAQINMTDGAVSSRTGPNGDLRTFQISAPVQPGNSGGPVLDLAGSVVGAVLAIFGNPKITSELGIVPQNVNFAISGWAIKELMSRAHLQPRLLYSSDLSIPDVAERGSKFTVSISCYN